VAPRNSAARRPTTWGRKWLTLYEAECYVASSYYLIRAETGRG
jgi:hypothetical protein